MSNPTPAPASPTPSSFIDKLAYLYIKDRKLIMARSHGKDTWYTVGGKREPGESDTEALIREVKEEGTIVRLICYTADFTGTLTPSSEIDEIGFLAHDQTEHLSHSGRLIMADLRAKDLID